MQMAADDCGTVRREYERGRHGAELHRSHQDKAAVTVASRMMRRCLLLLLLLLLCRQTFHLC